MALNDIMIREGRYAPGKLVPPRGEVLFWKREHKDAQGNETASLTCDNVVELRFNKPAATQTFQITIRGALVEGEGPEWVILVPAEKLGILFLPQGFTAEQSMMGAVYKLSGARDVRILADQMIGMPGINFTVQLLS